MPAHSSRLLQPLDVGCFAVLKRAYGQFVRDLMRIGVNHIDKLDFSTFIPLLESKHLIRNNKKYLLGERISPVRPKSSDFKP